MSSRHKTEISKMLSAVGRQVRTIHPRALAELGEEACIVALGVARDLRSEAIPPEKYDQTSYCGTACCIAGHIARRMGVEVKDFIWSPSILGSDALRFGDLTLFGHSARECPEAGADAIERYVYDGSVEPWKVPAMTGG